MIVVTDNISRLNGTYAALIIWAKNCKTVFSFIKALIRKFENLLNPQNGLSANIKEIQGTD